MMKQILTEKTLNFNSLEEIVFRKMCKLGCDCLKNLLEQKDAKLLEERDKSKYENRGLKTTHIDTRMGRVEFERHQYRYKDEDGKACVVYLLDEELEIFSLGKISSQLIEMMATQVTKNAYRPAAKAISDGTGMTVSHTTLWNIAGKIGERIEEEERERIKEMESGYNPGSKEVEVLFEEADGVYISLQGQDRKDKGKRRELKVGVIYEGWEKEGENRYKLVEKSVCSSFESGKEFKKIKDSMINSKYNMDEIKYRVQNGDGAEWIHDKDDASIISQLDPFHIRQAIVRKIRCKDTRKIINGLLEEQRIPLALDVVEAYSNSVSDEKEEKRAKELYIYLKNNEDMLVVYKKRDLPLPAPPTGLEYRNMGTMEHHICDVIAQRMKGRKGSWSIKRGSHMAKILCAKMSGSLYDIVNTKVIARIPEHYSQMVEEVMSAGKVPFYVGKSGDGNIRHGGMPFKDAHVTEGRKAIQNLLKVSYSL